MAGGGSKKKSHGPHHDLALTVAAVLTIAGVMCLQILARRLKRWSEHQAHANDILEASERELSVLGLIAFGLFVLEQTAAATQGQWVSVFHEVHFALFTVALFYVVVNVLLYGLSRHVGKLWRGFEQADMADHWGITARLHRLREKLHIPALDHHLFFGSYWLKGVVRDPVSWLEYQRCLEHMTFHEVRRDFLRVHHLPHSFSFADYLESCMQHVCLEFSEIRDAVWVLGILGLVVHLFFSTLLTPPSVATSLTALGAVVAGLGLVIFFKVKWIYWYILHSEILYQCGEIEDGEDDDRRSDVDRRLANFAELQRSLFWFGNPSLVVTLLESSLFVLSGSIALLFYKLDKLYKDGELGAPLGALAGATVLLLVLLPRIVPRFTLITHVGEMSDPRRIAEVVRKHQEGTSGTRRRDIDYGAPAPKATFKERFWRMARSAIVEPGISSTSAVLTVAFGFSVAVTLDESSARSVLKNDNVLVLRDVELVLGFLFLVESFSRLFVSPSEASRQLDVCVVVFGVGTNVSSFILRYTRPALARALHAASALIVFRVVNTMWHQELAKLRFEHIRLSPEDLLLKAEGGSAGGTPTTVGRSSSSPCRLGSNDLIFQSNTRVIKKRPSGTATSLPAWVGFYHPPASSVSDRLDQGVPLGRGRSSFFRDTSRDDEGISEAPPPPPETPALLDARKVAEVRAQDLLRAALLGAREDDATALAEVALEKALDQIRRDRAEAVVDSFRSNTSIIPPKPRLASVTSTKIEELEDALYFNFVLRTTMATKSKEKRRQPSLLGSMEEILHCAAPSSFRRSMSFASHIGDEAKEPGRGVVYHRVRLLLTRDQLVWYSAAGMISELLIESGRIRQVPADTSEPAAVALDGPEAVEPMGRLHLSTVLKIEVKEDPQELTCTTTAHILNFSFDETDEAHAWKSAVLSAIDQEDDDDPVHPIITNIRRRRSGRFSNASLDDEKEEDAELAALDDPNFAALDMSQLLALAATTPDDDDDDEAAKTDKEPPALPVEGDVCMVSVQDPDSPGFAEDTKDEQT